MIKARVSPWIPVALWAGVIFALSAIPSLSTDLGTWDLVLRKLGHLTEFAILGVLLYRALSRAPAAIALAALYAVTDELHQAFVSGRNAAARDWLIDTAGAVTGVILFKRVVR